MNPVQQCTWNDPARAGMSCFQGKIVLNGYTWGLVIHSNKVVQRAKRLRSANLLWKVACCNTTLWWGGKWRYFIKALTINNLNLKWGTGVFGYFWLGGWDLWDGGDVGGRNWGCSNNPITQSIFKSGRNFTLLSVHYRRLALFFSGNLKNPEGIFFSLKEYTIPLREMGFL